MQIRFSPEEISGFLREAATGLAVKALCCRLAGREPLLDRLPERPVIKLVHRADQATARAATARCHYRRPTCPGIIPRSGPSRRV